jgi:hypothetical protein
VIFRLCRELWTARTGKDTFWYAGMPEKTFNDLLDGKKRLAALEQAGKMIEKDPPLAMKMLDELEQKHPIETPAVGGAATRAWSAADTREQMRQLQELQQKNRARRQQLISSSRLKRERIHSRGP